MFADRPFQPDILKPEINIPKSQSWQRLAQASRFLLSLGNGQEEGVLVATAKATIVSIARAWRGIKRKGLKCVKNFPGRRLCDLPEAEALCSSWPACAGYPSSPKWRHLQLLGLKVLPGCCRAARSHPYRSHPTRSRTHPRCRRRSALARTMVGAASFCQSVFKVLQDRPILPAAPRRRADSARSWRSSLLGRRIMRLPDCAPQPGTEMEEHC